MLERLFRLEAHGTTVRREVLLGPAGLVRAPDVPLKIGDLRDLRRLLRVRPSALSLSGGLC
jgi:hypothetical protein